MTGNVVFNLSAPLSPAPSIGDTVSFLDGSTGLAEVAFDPAPDNNSLPGNDFIVSAGAMGVLQSVPPNQCMEAETASHELGHTLGLRHGGNDQNANKPGASYKSVMSYTWQLDCTPAPQVPNYSSAGDQTFDDFANLQLNFSDVQFHVSTSLGLGRGEGYPSDLQFQTPEQTLLDAIAKNGPLDTVPPVVAITSPAASANVALGSNLVVTVTASDNGLVARVSIAFDKNGNGVSDVGEAVNATKISANTYQATFSNVSGSAAARSISAIAWDGWSNSTRTAITVTVGTPAKVAVPNVAGLTQSAATTAITGAGLLVGVLTSASSSTVAAGSVISESPAAGTQVSVGSSVALVLSIGSQTQVATALRFVPVTPCRVADTRNAAGAFGGPSIAGGTTRDFIIPNSACNIPSTAQAYSLNVAVVPAGPLGFLTLWPSGQTQPLASTLNSIDGRIKSNAAIVPGGTGGAVSVFASNTTNVVLDINGYFVPATNPSALAFFPVTPCRIADTRQATPTFGGLLTGSQSRTFPILSSPCNIPATARAYSLSLAAVPSGPLGFITAWPTGQGQPVVASLNDVTGTVTANAAIVPAGAGGSIDIFASNGTNLVIDINGYFAPMATGGLSLYNVTPCRELDTRQPAGSPPFSGKLDTVISGNCGVPSTAQGFVMNATVVPPAALGFLTLWPQSQTQPVASTLNALDAAITSNLAIVPTVNGSISSFASNPTHLILDIFGYFAP